MEQLIDFLKGFNVQMLIGIGLMMWAFSRHFDSQLQKFEAKLDAQNARTDKLYELFIDLRKEFHEEMRDFRKKVIE
jgi:hypothetical protein